MRLRELLLTMAMMTGPALAQDGHGHGHGHGEGQGHGHGHAKGEDHHGPGQAIGAILPTYLRIQKALATDTLTDIPKAAEALAKAARTHHIDELAGLAEKLKGASLVDDRAAFRPISEGVVVAVLNHPPARKAFRVFDCAAAPGRWVQVRKEPQNPFQDGNLRTCGTPVEAVAAAPETTPAAPASAPVSAPASAHPH